MPDCTLLHFARCVTHNQRACMPPADDRRGQLAWKCMQSMNEGAVSSMQPCSHDRVMTHKVHTSAVTSCAAAGWGGHKVVVPDVCMARKHAMIASIMQEHDAW